MIGRARPEMTGWAAAMVAAAVTGALAYAWVDGRLGFSAPWLASLGSRFDIGLDSLGAPLAVYTAGIAVVVLAYAVSYMPRHLEEEGRPTGDAVPFFALMLAFALAMVLLMLAQDLVLIFLALEATALLSFLLIRFDGNAQSVAAARLALVVTAGSSLLFLLGLVMIAAETGTTVLAELRGPDVAEPIPDVALACLAAGVLAKSAQVPLHFWLPRAMAAPTPVSAYLHSAALVAAGVFVLQRLHFLLESAPWVLDALFWLAFASIGVGGFLALVSDPLKRVLAYSTIAQYGYGLALLAAGGKDGLVGAPFFIVAHGIAKCALFMTAGAVTQATGEDRLSRSGGLARAMPLLAFASFIAAAAIAGLPLTIGFFKDDLLLKVIVEKGAVAAALATAGIAVTFAYMARLWFGIFGGRRRPAGAPSWGLSIPVAVLSGSTLLFGVWPTPLEPIFGEAASVIAGEEQRAHLAYPDRLTAELGLAIVGWIAGMAIWPGARLVRPALEAVAEAAGRVGPAAAAAAIGATGRRLSNVLHAIEVRDARNRLTAIFGVSAGFVILGIVADGNWPRTGAVWADDLPLAAALVATAVAATVAIVARGHLAFLLLLSFVGMALALVFALAHAPEVALVLALVETLLTLLFIGVLSNMRHEVLLAARRQPGARRSAAVGVAAALASTATTWLALSVAKSDTPTDEYARLTETAHGEDIVTVILADFRGLDTAGELTVVVVAIVGAASIWAARRA